MRRMYFVVPALFMFFTMPTSATSCVSEREFKVRQVCGVVSYKSQTIADVPVELLDASSTVIATVQTNAKGEFAFAPVKDDKYILQIKFAGFARAWQLFRVSHSKHNQACQTPMRVKLELAGSCSDVEKSK